MNIFDTRQLKICKDTVRNPAKALLGGVTVSEAKRELKYKFKWSDDQIKQLACDGA